MPDANPDKLMSTAQALYIVFAACAISGFIQLWSVVIIATIALIVSVVIAYRSRTEAGESFYASHFHWIIRTFWIGGWVYLPILTILAAVAICVVIDWSEVTEALKTAALENAASPGGGDAAVVVNTVMIKVIYKNLPTISHILDGFIFPAIAWWLWRCWKGWTLLKKGQPVPDVMKWV